MYPRLIQVLKKEYNCEIPPLYYVIYPRKDGNVIVRNVLVKWQR